MFLPAAESNLRKYEEHEFTFKGLRHYEGARDGEIYDMENITLDAYPSLAVRKPRQKLDFDIEGDVYGIGSADKLFWCSGTGGNKAAAEQSFASGENTNSVLASETGDQSTNGALEGGDTSSTASGPPSPQGEGLNVWFYYNGVAKFPVSVRNKEFAVINKYVCIFPDKKYYSLWDGEEKEVYESLEKLQEATVTDESLKDGDVYAVGSEKPYAYFQFNSQGKWDTKATTKNHAIQSRWVYLMDSWGELSYSVKVKAGEYGSQRKAFMSGKRTFDKEERNYIAFYANDKGSIPWLRPGDSVKITTVDKSENVKTYYSKLYGKEYVKEFSLGYDYLFYYFDAEINVSETNCNSVSIERVIPDLKHCFCHDNRLWGCDKDKICASKLGDPFNFSDYSTLADASWTVAILSTEPFTGGISYNGYPTFFKEDRIIRVSGNYPSQYSTFETADVPGVMKGSEKSLAIANGYLYYLSPDGVCAYSGSYPSVISEALGESLSDGISGAGSDKYYIEASTEGDSASGKAVYVYDTSVRAWTKEESIGALGFTDIGRDLYALTEDGIYLLDSIKDKGEAEEDIASFLEFAPIYDGHLKKKGLSKLHLSLKVETGTTVNILISYDDEGYEKVITISPTMRRNVNIPLTIKRCGYYQIKIVAKGGYTLYGIGRERYFGSDM